MPRDSSSLFITDREIEYINSINTEFIEIVVQQKVIYYAIENNLTQSDELYGESLKKIFRNPIEIYCRVFLKNMDVTTGNMGLDKIYEIEVFFQRDRVMNDLGFYPREGDFISWSNKYFEIKKVREPQLFGGLSQQKIGVFCDCTITRQEVFNANSNKPYDPSIVPDSESRK